jgi:transcriptional regulator with XRE-family HTH domain
MWELGKRRPDYVKLEEIADYFNVDMNYLLGKTNVRNSYQEQLGRRPITDDELRFALFGDAENITDADLAKVKEFAAFIKSGKG